MMLWLRIRLGNSVTCFDGVLHWLNVLNIQVNRLNYANNIRSFTNSLIHFQTETECEPPPQEEGMSCGVA
jgi:hypothetical protein